MKRTTPVRNWAMLATLVAMWGTAFMFVKIGVATVPPVTLVAARVLIAALVLYALMRMRGHTLPALSSRWLTWAALGVLGNCAPFYLITWGQQYIDSALAGILVAVMPLTTLVLAHFLIRDERMTLPRACGFLLGFCGIVLLMGPAAIASVGGAAGEVIAQASILAGALCYAANSVLARRAISDDFLTASTGVMLVSSVIMVPAALLIDRPWMLTPSISAIAAVVWLGIGPTALATIVYFRLIAAAGPTFMSLVNYMSPVVALFAGVTLLDESPGPMALTGLTLILVGIAVSRRR